MTVLRVEADYLNSNARDDRQGTYGVLAYSVYFAQGSNWTAMPFEALANASIPAGYSEHPYQSGIYVVSRDFGYQGPLRGTVSCQYESIVSEMEKPPEIQWGGVTTEIPVESDRSGNPITNSADESPDPLLMKDHFDAVLTVVRNEPGASTTIPSGYTVNAYYNPAIAINAHNKLNAAQVTIDGVTFPAETLKIISYKGSKVYPSDAPATMNYYQVTYELAYRADGWKKRFVDEGYRTKSGGAYTIAKDSEGNPLSEPILLNGSGGQLGDGETPVFIEKDIYQTTTLLASINLNLPGISA